MVRARPQGQGVAAAGAGDARFQAALAFDVATWVAIASISAGDRQSYGSSPSSLRRDLIPFISDGLTPDSITEDTNAANPGAAQPPSVKSSGWMKSRPWNGWSLFSIRPNIWVPQTLQAWRW